MEIRKSSAVRVRVKKEQESQISTPERMEKALKNEDFLGFDLIENNKTVGFALFRRFEEGGFFLWNYLIDADEQGKGYGKCGLKLLIDELCKNHALKQLTTTYIYGNEIAKKFYEGVGFVETDVVDEEDCHEVNMVLNF